MQKVYFIPFIKLCWSFEHIGKDNSENASDAIHLEINGSIAFSWGVVTPFVERNVPNL